MKKQVGGLSPQQTLFFGGISGANRYQILFDTLQKGPFLEEKRNTGATQGIVAASVVEVVVEAVLEVNGVDLLELSSLMSKFNSSGRYLGLQLGKARLKQPSTSTFNKWNCKILSDLSVFF